MVLSTAYLGNIQYFSKLLGGAVIDTGEHYLKQSYRNRADVMTSGGVTSLVVPVLQPSGIKTPTRDIRIDNTKHWRNRHFQAIVSAYSNSPYFFHYRDFFEPVYRREHTFLVDLNRELQEVILSLMKVAPAKDTLAKDAPVIKYSAEYVEDVPEEEDFRISISPKPRLQKDDPTFDAPEYYQVFAEKHPFAPNMSVIDLLFCEGPATAGIIRNAILR